MLENNQNDPNGIPQLEDRIYRLKDRVRAIENYLKSKGVISKITPQKIGKRDKYDFWTSMKMNICIYNP